MRHKSIVCLLLLTSLLVTHCGSDAPGETEQEEPISLNVLFAGSLIIPFDDLEQAYEAQHPNVDVLMEGHGSIQVVRHVTEIHDMVDVAVTADHSLIPLLMYPSTVPETGRPYADWTITFATNRLALAYTPESRYADEINADNWYKVIARPDVTVGISDPRFDACGYRSLMALKLAETAYDQPTIFVDMLMGRFKMPIQAHPEGDQTIIHVPEIVTPKPDSGILIRGASIQLIALLESRDLDYAFEYESVIQQHGLELVRLPAGVNMGDETYADDYGQVQVQLDFQRFASVNPEFTGQVIGYGLTIPANAPHPEAAAEFVAFLLGPEGRAILEAREHPLIVPARVDRHDALPEILKPLCIPQP